MGLSHLFRNRAPDIFTEIHEILDIALDQGIEILDRWRGWIGRRSRRSRRRGHRLWRLRGGALGRRYCLRAVDTISSLQGHCHVLEARSRGLQPVGKYTGQRIVRTKHAGVKEPKRNWLSRRAAYQGHRHAYRLIRVVKLCMWLPVVILPNPSMRRGHDLRGRLFRGKVKERQARETSSR